MLKLNFMASALLAACAFLLCFTTGCKKANNSAPEGPYNVLFITIDDLRPQLGCYGDSIVKTPNIDRLASTGLLFKKAYCQQALCGPSRTSILTGLRPETNGVSDLRTHFRETVPDVVTLPQLFKNNGYASVGLSKVFHLVGFAPKVFGNMDDPESWSRPLWLPSRSAWGPVGDSIFQRNYQECLKKGPIGYGNIPRSVAFGAPDIPDSSMSDGETALQAMKDLRALKDTSFFMAVGFYKPHLPYVAPKKYWDLYDKDQLQLPGNQYAPEGAPPYAYPGLDGDIELRSYTNIPDSGNLSEDLKKDLLHGYLASISYIDAQVGLLLDELERLNLRDKTIIVLLGDHGYQIGEHDLWGKKHTNYETSTNAPLIISVPGMDKSGSVTHSLTEFIDIYPTVAELSGLTAPDNLDGNSLVPLINDPNVQLKDAAFSSYPRGGRVGTTMRTEQYRFTEWKHRKTGKIEYELYDHSTDPAENRNVANDDGYEEVKKKLLSTFSKQRP